ncbi:MAG: hypothetical protein PHY30_00210 [Candidatus Pacebacteria bacterium]|nr:hypothetical protein [Candidatus Paceibacterota bacterium]
MMKKIFLTLFLGLFSFCNFTNAQINLNDDKVDIDFFYSKTCPHCSDANEFLKDISLENSNIQIEKFEISKKESVSLLNSYYDTYSVDESHRGGVPVIFIENYYFIGFQKGVSEDKISAAINNFNLSNGLKNNDSYVVGEVSSMNELKQIELPLIGKIDLSSASPLIFSILFGFLDGFNACAMAALAFLLAILIGLGDRRKLILIGGVFILVSGIIYYLFIGAWFNIFLILPHIDLITYAIGALMIILGVYVLKEYFDGVICKLCEIDPNKKSWFSENQQKLLLKIREIVSSEKNIFLILGGVIFVAAGVNSIELICSFGLPVAFTKILTSYNISLSAYYFYLLIYDIFYMLDDFIIFLIAVFTFNLANESERYVKLAKFISGVILILLGIIIIFFPEVLGSI